MKKTFFSALFVLLILAVFGATILIVIAGPAGPLASSQPEPAAARPLPQPAQAVAPTFAAGEVSYEISQPDYAWIDISDSEERLTAADFVDNVGSEAIDIGFYFPFFTGIYDQVRFSDNGYLYFGADETAGGNIAQAVASAVDPIHNLIAPFGADLFRYPGESVVYIARQMEPERRLVVQFERAYWCCNQAAANDFEVILYPDGRILTQYKTVQSEDPAHAYLTVGLENEDGTQGHTFYTGFLGNTELLRDQTAVLYDPNETVLGRLLFLPETVTAQAAPGQVVTLSADLLNLSGLDSRFTLTSTLQVNGASVPVEPARSPEPAGTAEAEPTEAPPDAAELAWRFKVLAEPGQLGHTEAAPLLVELFIPETAGPGDLIVLTFRALSDPVLGFEPVVTMTVLVTNDGSEEEGK